MYVCKLTGFYIGLIHFLLLVLDIVVNVPINIYFISLPKNVYSMRLIASPQKIEIFYSSQSVI